jgi:hypothetical protein
MRDHPGRIGQGGEQCAQDAQRRLLPAAPADLAAHRAFEPGQPEPAGAGQLTAVAAGDPDLGAERLAGGVQTRRPHAFEQGADLLDLADRLHNQLFAAGAKCRSRPHVSSTGSGR